MTSVRRYLISVLIAVLVLTSFLAALQSYRLSAERTNVLFDQDLTLVAAALLQQHQMPDESRGLGLAVQVVRDGTLTYRNELAPKTPLLEPKGFSEQNFSSKRWRVYIADTAAGVSVMVAQPVKQRLELTDEVIAASVYPVVLGLPLQAILIWLVVTRALSPLRAFSAQLATRKANDLSPVRLEQVPEELEQVLQSTNQLFERLSATFEREKRFAADVAHELRTPLSVLEITLHNALTHWHQQGRSGDDESIRALREGVERMRHLIEQIMVLNRTHPDNFQAKMELLDWAGMCRSVVAENYEQIESRQQRISMEGEEHLVVRADPFALRLAVSNLLGNAIKYTPPGGDIRLTLKKKPDLATLTLEDSGPGIAVEEREQVFQRFYRVGGDRHPSGAPGSGLGLAIVHDIVTLHGGRILLGASTFASGLKVTVELPA